MNGMNIFWAVGAVFLACLAWSVMPTLGWRYLVAFSTLPLAIFVIFAPKMVPESQSCLCLSFLLPQQLKPQPPQFAELGH